jgi:hypothetical protein
VGRKYSRYSRHRGARYKRGKGYVKRHKSSGRKSKKRSRRRRR